MFYIATRRDMPVQFLALDEAAAILGVSKSTVSRMISDAQLAAVKLRTRIVIPALAIHALVRGEAAVVPALPAGLLNVVDVASMFTVSKATLYRMIDAAEFPAVRVRGRVLIPGETLHLMLSHAVRQQRLVDPADWLTVASNVPGSFDEHVRSRA
jgi:excisionase family DNA binding protein